MQFCRQTGTPAGPLVAVARIGILQYRAGRSGDGLQPCPEVVENRHQTAATCLRNLRPHVDETMCKVNVLPIQSIDFRNPESGEASDGVQGQQVGVVRFAQQRGDLLRPEDAGGLLDCFGPLGIGSRHAQGPSALLGEIPKCPHIAPMSISRLGPHFHAR
jgi:hypothetical protein